MKFLKIFNLNLFSIIVWFLIILMIKNSESCGNDKILWSILCLIGFNYSFNEWRKLKCQ